MDTLVSAVRELRAATGDSQQSFATKLGMSLRAIANYEAGREPTGRALYKLDQLARASGRPDLASRFTRALAYEMDWSHEPAEPVWLGVVRELVRNEHLCEGWPRVAELMIAELESLIGKARSGTRIEGPLKDPGASVANLERWLVEARYARSQSAEKELEQLAQEWFEQGAFKTKEQAYSAVLVRYPDLYGKYKAERAAAAVGTQYEQSLAAPYLDEAPPQITPRRSAPEASKQLKVQKMAGKRQRIKKGK